MPSCAQLRGIKLTDAEKVVRAEIEGSVDETPVLLESDGTDPCTSTYNSRNRITVEGRGALPDGWEAGASDAFVFADHDDGVTGIQRTEERQATGQHHSWTVSATNWPHAVPAVEDP